MTDIEGGGNVGAIFLNSANPTERFNLPDTLKAQHTARLTAGHVLYSDMGRILCSITGDSLGWHDPLGGHSNAAIVTKKYGEATYQECRNNWHQNAHNSFMIQLAKYGLGARDMMANVNFFSKVKVSDDGSMIFIPQHSLANSFVELRAEMDVLVILNACQHPLDPNPHYEPKPIRLIIKTVASPGPDDLCRLSAPENGRGFILTERYFL